MGQHDRDIVTQDTSIDNLPDVTKAGFQALQSMVNDIANSQTAKLLSIALASLSDAEITAYIEALPVCKRIDFVITLQAVRTNEFMASSKILKSAADIADIVRKAGQLENSGDAPIMGAGHEEIAIIRLLLKYKKYLSTNDRRAIIQFIKERIQKNK